MIQVMLKIKSANKCVQKQIGCATKCVLLNLYTFLQLIKFFRLQIQ